MKKINLILVAILLSFNLSAEENENRIGGLYLGLGLGSVTDNVKYDNNDHKEDKGILFKNNATSNIFIGYNFSRYFAVEGDIIASFPTQENYIGGSISSSFTYMGLSVLGKYPLQQHIPFLKLGLGYSEYEMKDKIYGVRTDLTTFSGVSYNIGIGYEFAINKNNSFIFQYDYIRSSKVDVKDSSMDSQSTGVNIYQSSLNISYKYTF